MTEIIIYTIVWILCFLLVYANYKRRVAIHLGRKYMVDDYKQRSTKMTILTAFFVAFLFTLFDVYVTSITGLMGGDRENYYVDFIGVRPFGTTGLQCVSDFIHAINGNFHTLLYFSMFVSVFITMIAYRISKTASPYCFFLLCLTQYFLTILTALKQCYASAFGILCLVLILDYNSKASNLGAVLCIVIACLFHPSGYILIPLYIMLKGNKNRNSIIAYLFLLVILSLFFDRIMLMGASMLSPIVPSLSTKVTEYFSEGSSITQDSSTISFLKGVPYYIIVILGIVKRQEVKSKIDNYDNYLIVVVTGAFIYLMSIYSSWLSRFVYLFGFISIIFFSNIIKTINPRNGFILSTLIQFLLFLTTYRFMILVFAM